MSRGNHARSRLYLGLTLIALGTVYGLEKLGLLSVDLFWNALPLVLTWIGITKLRASTGLGRGVGIGLVALGLLLTTNNFGWIHLSPWDLWPLVPLGIGLRLLFFPEPDRQTVESFHSVSSFTLMAGLVRGNNSAHFQGGDMVAIMGGAELDLRQARITEGPAVLDTFAFWGGIDLKVPKDWKVTIKGIPLLGAFEDERVGHPTGDDRPVDPLDDEDSDDGFLVPGPPQELVVRGFAVMGGVSVS